MIFRQFTFLSLRHYIYLQSLFIVAVTLYSTAGSYTDDAYISLRYAKHLLEGYGLTWNPNERVEGYTNFLFVILTAALGRIGVDLVTASRLISFAAYLCLTIVFARYVGIIGNRIPADKRDIAADLSFSLVAASVPILVWCYCGLEPVLMASVLLIAVCQVLRMAEGQSNIKHALLAGIFFALTTLTRIDGALYILCSLGFLGTYRLIRRNNAPVSLRHLFITGSCYAAIIAPYMCWRYAYFGDWLPNTYYAKFYGIAPLLRLSHGVYYLLLYMATPPLLILFAGGMFVTIAAKKKLTLAIGYIAFLIAASFVYIANVGGDNMPYFRFFVPLLPIIALLIYHCICTMKSFPSTLIRDIVFGLLVFSFLQLCLIAEGEKIALGALSGEAVAPYVQSHWPKGSLVALNAAGALPYLADDNRYIDMLGLNDRHIAHREITELRTADQNAMGHVKGDGVYVLSRQPDYIIFSLSWGSDTPDYLSDMEIEEQPDFKAHYKRVEAYVDVPPALMPAIEELSKRHSPIAPVLDTQKRLRFIYFQKIPSAD